MIWILGILIAIFIFFGLRGLLIALSWVMFGAVLNIFIPETAMCFLVLFAIWGTREFFKRKNPVYLLTLLTPASIYAIRGLLGVDVPALFAIGFVIFIILRILALTKKRRL